MRGDCSPVGLRSCQCPLLTITSDIKEHTIHRTSSTLLAIKHRDVAKVEDLVVRQDVVERHLLDGVFVKGLALVLQEVHLLAIRITFVVSLAALAILIGLPICLLADGD